MNTIDNVLRSVFPTGTKVSGSTRSWRSAPDYPPDVFAAVAQLVHLTGMYTVFAATADHLPVPDKTPPQVAAGHQWRMTFFSPPKAVKDMWRILWDARAAPIGEWADPSGGLTPWARAAMFLLVAADEASEGIGFDVGPKSRWPFPRFLIASIRRRGRASPAVSSLTVAANAGIAAVLPKTRTPSVGCTLRSLTKNLALMPRPSQVLVRWHLAQSARMASDVPLNLLLVPIPYRLSARAFDDRKTIDGNFGLFDLRQTWLGESGRADDARRRVAAEQAIVKHTRALVNAAKSEVGPVDGIVFPELALNQSVLRQLMEELESDPELELLIAGVSDDHGGRTGNFVTTVAFTDSIDGRPRRHVVHTRGKHHRWKLEKSQILSYSLGSVLNPEMSWWENVELTGRELGMFLFRKNSTLTTLICEDLARIDPCQEVVRSIGPNLVIALLMDGPQLSTRWPARYATVLADDPGSSVLSMTSMGLIGRQNSLQEHPKSRVFALWKQDNGHQREISLPDGASAVVLTLTSATRSDHILDGRVREDAQSWILSGIHPISVAIPEALNGV